MRTRSRSTTVCAVLAAALALAATPLTASAAIRDKAADVILGQPHPWALASYWGRATEQSLLNPNDVAFDAEGNVWVADTGYNRVLGYVSPRTTDKIADVVIGQPTFSANTPNHGGISASSLSSPRGVAVDSLGNLYVADTGNNRVLQYDQPFATDSVADRVFGKPSFTSNTNPISVTAGPVRLSTPYGVEVDRMDNLWVADTGHHRVVIFSDPLLLHDDFTPYTGRGDAAADKALGQPDLYGKSAGSGPSQMSGPTGVDSDAELNVFVADRGNHRILRFDDPWGGDTQPDMVRGGPSSVNNPNQGLKNPSGIAVDANGNVFVADTGNNRVVLYRYVVVAGMHNYVYDYYQATPYGQPSLTTNAPNNGGMSSSSLSSPTNVATGPNDEIAIADSANNRVSLLDAPVAIVTEMTFEWSESGEIQLVIRGRHMMTTDYFFVEDWGTFPPSEFGEVAENGSVGVMIIRGQGLDDFAPQYTFYCGVGSNCCFPGGIDGNSNMFPVNRLLW
jgi:sugar lactone lactonase YvrE